MRLVVLFFLFRLLLCVCFCSFRLDSSNSLQKNTNRNKQKTRDEDSSEERRLKLGVLAAYDARLTERERRRAVIQEHGLLSMRRMQGLARRRAPHEREQFAQLRVFAR